MSLFGGMFGSMWDSLWYGSSASKQASDDAYEKQLNLMREQQKWQEHVAKNHHSWEVQSLRDAGLNPLLSATGGAGASFSGGAPSFSGGHSAGGRSNLDPLDDIASVLAIAKTVEEIAKLKKEAQKTDAETKNLNEQTEGQRLHNEHRRKYPSSGDHPHNRLLNNLDDLGEYIYDSYDSVEPGSGEWNLDKIIEAPGNFYKQSGKSLYRLFYNGFKPLFGK